MWSSSAKGDCMRLLAIDTAGTTGSVALAQWDDQGTMTLLGSVDLPGRTYSVRLLPAISTLLEQNHIALPDVDGLSVVRGPGSFTGLRVGISAVKGLAEATGKPVIALSRLAVMASLQPEARHVHAILDAGREEFYYGIYRNAGGECVQESLETAATLREKMQCPTYADGCILTEKTVAEKLVPDHALADAFAQHGESIVVHPTAVDGLPLAWRCWKQLCMTDIATLDANYLRLSDVELFARPKYT